MANKLKTSSGLQGLIRIIADATVGTTDLVEGVHKRVVHPPFLPSTPIQHLITKIAGITYKSIRWSAKLVGSTADKALGEVSSLLDEVETADQSDAMRSVLNGVVGDYLEENENPLKITMQFRHFAKVISPARKSLEKAYPTINGKILLMVHGLCMNDAQWTLKDHNHGALLANELHKTPVYLHYNSGRHISTNGHNLNELLEKLVMNWPVPVEELIIVAHSMGGLVARSALYYGQQQEKLWTRHIKKIVFLGTPHHGAPLERAGNHLHTMLEAIHYTKPFARLGKIRSAGVTDLRYGNIVDDDWQNNDRFKKKADQRQHIPLPEQVECYCIAGTLGKVADSVSSRLIGDNLVTVKSATGQHKDPAKDLKFKKENILISYETSHLDLLSNPEIYLKMKEWLV